MLARRPVLKVAPRNMNSNLPGLARGIRLTYGLAMENQFGLRDGIFPDCLVAGLFEYHQMSFERNVVGDRYLDDRLEGRERAPVGGI